MTLSGSRVRDAAAAGAGAAEAEAKGGEPRAGKAPGIPIPSGCVDAAAGSGTTPPSRLPDPANPLRGAAT